MPEKVTSLNGLKVTLEYGSYSISALNVRYVKSRLYIYTVLYQTLTSHFVSLALGLML